jgi:hypothetical protein
MRVKMQRCKESWTVLQHRLSNQRLLAATRDRQGTSHRSSSFIASGTPPPMAWAQAHLPASGAMQVTEAHVDNAPHGPNGRVGQDLEHINMPSSGLAAIEALRSSQQGALRASHQFSSSGGGGGNGNGNATVSSPVPRSAACTNRPQKVNAGKATPLERRQLLGTRRDTPVMHIEARHEQAARDARALVEDALLAQGLEAYRYVEG